MKSWSIIKAIIADTLLYWAFCLYQGEDAIQLGRFMRKEFSRKIGVR